MLDRLRAVGQSGVRVRRLGGDRAGEIRLTRFLRNEQVAPAEMFSTASSRTAACVGDRHVLAIQDTTSLRDDGKSDSILLHPTIAVDAANGALYGLVHAELLHRQGGRKASRKQRAFSDKQSHRWLRGAEAAARLAKAGASAITVIADRESDIYEEFACRPSGVDLLIRAAQDRCLADGRRLFACAAPLPELGRIAVDLPAAPGRRARTATLSLRACPVALARPGRPAAQAASLPPQVDLSLVEAREIDPPDGIEPAQWRLLTTHPATTLAEAARIVGFYRTRWTIEQLFRICKTQGFNIEAVQIAEQRPFENLAAATLIAAIQLLQLVRDRDGHAKRPLQDVLDPSERPALEAVCATLEGKTARQKNPHPPGSLAYAAWVFARLGGWTGYYGNPGPIVTLKGMLRFQAISQGWSLRHNV